VIVVLFTSEVGGCPKPICPHPVFRQVGSQVVQFSDPGAGFLKTVQFPSYSGARKYRSMC
jgi:hypothetical protein